MAGEHRLVEAMDTAQEWLPDMEAGPHGPSHHGCNGVRELDSRVVATRRRADYPKALGIKLMPTKPARLNPVFVAAAIPIMLVGAWLGGFFGKIEPGRSFAALVGTWLVLFLLSRVIPYQR